VAAAYGASGIDAVAAARLCGGAVGGWRSQGVSDAGLNRWRRNTRSAERPTLISPCWPRRRPLSCVGSGRSGGERPPPPTLSGRLMRLVLAWDIQAGEDGGESPAFRRQLQAVVTRRAGGARADEAVYGLSAPPAAAGTRLLKSWGGRPTRCWSPQRARSGREHSIPPSPPWRGQ
jgi:hypothetical protein